MLHGKVKTCDEPCVCPEGGSLMGTRCSRCGGWENICALRSEVLALRADLAARTAEKDAANMDAGKWFARATLLEGVLRDFPGHESEIAWSLWIAKKDAALKALPERKV